MKKIIVLVCLLVAYSTCFAGEIRQLPQPIVITEPTAQDAEFLTLTFFYGDEPYAEVRYNVLDSQGRVRGQHTLTIRNDESDNPATTWNDMTMFTDFVAGYGATINSRSSVSVWNHIKKTYELAQ